MMTAFVYTSAHGTVDVVTTTVIADEYEVNSHGDLTFYGPGEYSTRTPVASRAAGHWIGVAVAHPERTRHASTT